MKIYFRTTLDPVTGHVIDQHFIDTADPQVIATFTQLQADKTKLAASGWGNISVHPLALPGETEWAQIVRRVNALATPDPLKALNLT